MNQSENLIASEQWDNSSTPQSMNVESVDLTDTVEEDEYEIEGGKRKLKSKVWAHFDREKGENGIFYGVCKYCKKKYKIGSTHGTSTLHDHYKRCAKRPKQDIRQMLLRSGSKKNDSKQELHNYVFDQQQSRHECQSCFIK